MKSNIYRDALSQIEALVNDESDFTAAMSNIAAILHHSFSFFWTGFYLVKEERNEKVLVIGPFQGPVACTRIAKGKGVCGTAWKNKSSIVVDNVHHFANHIACSDESKSEIVIPIIIDDKVLGVLDIDSENYSNFDEVDQSYLERICQLLENKVWN